MKIIEKREETTLILYLEGRLDTTTAPLLDTLIKEKMDGIAVLEIDMSQLEYISSAGLSVLLTALKIMKQQGALRIRNVCSEVMEVFKITGFTEILNIE